MRRTLLCTAIVTGTFLAAAMVLADEPSYPIGEIVAPAPVAGPVLDIRLDYAHVLVLEAPASTIAIGNSGIVEATLSDDQTVILTAQAPGTTNLIVLDEDGTELVNTVVRVIASGDYLTTVYRGSARYTYSCADRCTPVVAIGDEPQFFDNSVSQIETRQTLAGEAAQ